MSNVHTIAQSNTALTKDKVKELRDNLQEQMSNIHLDGYSISFGNASFGAQSVTFKLEVNQLGSNGQVMTKEHIALNEIGHYYGLQFGYKFSYQEHQYRVIGLKKGAKKYPIIAERLSDGKQFVFGLEQVKKGVIDQ